MVDRKDYPCNCESCPFAGQRKVFGEGTRILKEYDAYEQVGSVQFKSHITELDNEGQYDVVGVGMAPAREEEKQGRPFVGVSGQILRRTLQQQGIDNFYLCNVFLCPIIEDTGVPVAITKCRDVVQEVLDRKPKLTIALGDLPLHALMDTPYTIKEIEGRIVPSKVGPLLPLTHPAYYWRNPNEFIDFIECSRSGIRFLQGKYAQCVEPKYTVVTPYNMSDVLNRLNAYDEIAIDTETTGFDAYGWDPCQILEAGLAGSIDEAFIVPKQYLPEFKELLETKKCIFWNAPFDDAFLRQEGIKSNIYYDGMLAHYTMDERGYSHGLKKVSRIYLGADDWEKKLEPYLGKKNKENSYSVLPTDVRHEYLAKDVTRTYQLKGVLDEFANKKLLHEMLMPACRMFTEIEAYGIRVNPVLLMQMEPILAEELSKLERELYEATGRWINPNSPKQVQYHVYEELGLPADSYLGLTTGKEYLQQFAYTEPTIDKILQYRQLSKEKGTYVEGFAKFVDRQYRIHPRINLFKAVSGRLASENPSIMNIKGKSKFKKIFIADRMFIQGDIKGNELRWYAINAKDKELINIFNRPVTPEDPYANDPHNWVATCAYGAEKAKELRTPAKAVVFGRLYGRGTKSIERQVGGEVIDQLITIVDSVFPAIGKFRREVMDRVKRDGYLESYFGRKRRFPLITQENKSEVEREAVNFMQQSPGSDLMLLNMLHLWEIRKRWDILPLWPVHDSITSDGPPDPSVIDEIKKEVEEYSADITNNMIPFIWEFDWGYDWSMSKEPIEWKL